MAKNKMKTRRAVAKRFSMTGSGKIKRKKRGLRHILEKRSPKSKRQAGMPAFVHAADESRVKRCMPNSL